MHCWARYLLYAVFAVLGVGQMMAACGQKGPLYLPESEPEPAQQQAPTPPEAIEDEEAPVPGTESIPSPGAGMAEPFDDVPETP
jgi:predicted small lipoprotein YifL